MYAYTTINKDIYALIAFPVQHHVNYGIILKEKQIFNQGIFSMGIFIFGGDLPKWRHSTN